MYIREHLHQDGEEITGAAYHVMTDDQQHEMSNGSMHLFTNRFSGHYIRTMAFGGIHTKPEYRRKGSVRLLFETTLPQSKRFGTSLSILHPFSYSYYRKFGYEKVSDTISLTMPIGALDFVDRYSDLVPLSDEQSEGLLTMFDRFSEKRNLMMKRNDTNRFTSNNLFTFLLYNDQKEVSGYVSLEKKKHFDGINRMIGDQLFIGELGFLDKESLLRILGFLRMFEGEMETVKFFDVAPIPELSMVLQHQMETTCEVRPDVMARVLDTEMMLHQFTFPEDHGVFTMQVDDWLENVRGHFRVEYQNGICEIERLSDESECEVILPQTALARFAFGVDTYTPETAAYLDGVQIKGQAKDFFRAFPKQICGLYEHF